MVGNTSLYGGWLRAIDGSNYGTQCHFMGMGYTINMDYLHVCDGGPIVGRYVTIYRPPTEAEVIQIAEIYVWDRPQPEDQSEYHGKNNLLIMFHSLHRALATLTTDKYGILSIYYKNISEIVLTF